MKKRGKKLYKLYILYALGTVLLLTLIIFGITKGTIHGAYTIDTDEYFNPGPGLLGLRQISREYFGAEDYVVLAKEGDIRIEKITEYIILSTRTPTTTVFQNSYIEKRVSIKEWLGSTASLIKQYNSVEIRASSGRLLIEYSENDRAAQHRGKVENKMLIEYQGGIVKRFEKEVKDYIIAGEIPPVQYTPPASLDDPNLELESKYVEIVEYDPTTSATAWNDDPLNLFTRGDLVGKLKKYIQEHTVYGFRTPYPDFILITDGLIQHDERRKKEYNPPGIIATYDHTKREYTKPPTFPNPPLSRSQQKLKKYINEQTIYHPNGPIYKHSSTLEDYDDNGVPKSSIIKSIHNNDKGQNFYNYQTKKTYDENGNLIEEKKTEKQNDEATLKKQSYLHSEETPQKTYTFNKRWYLDTANNPSSQVCETYTYKDPSVKSVLLTLNRDKQTFYPSGKQSAAELYDQSNNPLAKTETTKKQTRTMCENSYKLLDITSQTTYNFNTIPESVVGCSRSETYDSACNGILLSQSNTCGSTAISFSACNTCTTCSTNGPINQQPTAATMPPQQIKTNEQALFFLDVSDPEGQQLKFIILTACFQPTSGTRKCLRPLSSQSLGATISETGFVTFKPQRLGRGDAIIGTYTFTVRITEKELLPIASPLSLPLSTSTSFTIQVNPESIPLLTIKAPYTTGGTYTLSRNALLTGNAEDNLGMKKVVFTFTNALYPTQKIIKEIVFSDDIISSRYWSLQLSSVSGLTPGQYALSIKAYNREDISSPPITLTLTLT